MTQICQITHCSLCYALKQSYWVPHKKANLKEICRLENDLYKIAIGRILATHAQNYQIHSTHRVTRGNLYAKILNEQDSKELSPRSLDKMLLELQVNSQNVQSIQLTKFFRFSKPSKLLKCSKFKPCQIIILEYSYDQNDAIISILVTQKIYWICLDLSDVNWYVSTNMLRLVLKV